MKPTEYIEIVNKIEREFSVDQWLVDGIHIWPIVRIYLSTNMQTKEKHPMPPSKLKMFYRLLLNFFNEKRYQLKFGDKNHRQPQADVVFLSSSIYKTKINGKWYDRFVDPIRQKLDEDGITSFQFEYVPRRKFRTKQFFPSKYIQSKIDLIKYKHEFTKVTISRDLRNDYGNVEDYLRDYSLEQCLPPIDRIARDVLIVKELSEFFNAHIKRLKAKIGMVVYYYGIEGYAFNLACRNAGITSVDIQHGVQGSLHRAYGRWNRVPLTGYEYLPEVYWCWADEEYQAIYEWSQGYEQYHRPMVGGYPWLELWKDAANPLTRKYIKEVKNYIQDEESNILVTLQKGREVPGFLLQAINQAPSHWKWWIRLHPAMLSELGELRQLFRPFSDRIIIEEATDLPLYSILANVSLHITEWSTTVIEADAFKVPSVVLHPIGVELFEQYIQKGTVMYADDSVSLLKSIEALLPLRKNGDDDVQDRGSNQAGIQWTKHVVNNSKVKQRG